MELLFVLIGFVGGVVAVVGMLRRAKAKPAGMTAKIVEIMGGGGPDPTK